MRGELLPIMLLINRGRGECPLCCIEKIMEEGSASDGFLLQDDWQFSYSLNKVSTKSQRQMCSHTQLHCEYLLIQIPRNMSTCILVIVSPQIKVLPISPLTAM